MNSRKAANDKISDELGKLSEFKFSDVKDELGDVLEFILSRPSVYDNEEEALEFKAENDRDEVVEGRFCIFCDHIGEEEGHDDECPIFRITVALGRHGDGHTFVPNYTWEGDRDDG